MLYIAMGILGATVMPHNLYLHSSIVQTRAWNLNDVDKKQAIKYATIDSTVALSLAFFVNAAIVVVAAAVFHRAGRYDVADIRDAYLLLTPLLGMAGASTLFALALLASGQASTLTATLAGQIVMEGFIHIRLAGVAAPPGDAPAGADSGADHDRVVRRAAAPAACWSRARWCSACSCRSR